MERVPIFSAQELEAACRVLGHTVKGLSGTEIGYILRDCGVDDVSPDMTKWKRLFNALSTVQNRYQVGNHLIMFINRALNPVRYTRDRESFRWRIDELNVVLSMSGYRVREDGKVAKGRKETTLNAALEKVKGLRIKLEGRNSHPIIYEYCDAELLQNNYFHAVFEAIKGINTRVKALSGLEKDGAELISEAFLGKSPILVINGLETISEKSEQKGFANIIIGLFGAVRNPVAHELKTHWPMTEHDALDVFSMISFVHRKLDTAVKVTTP